MYLCRKHLSQNLTGLEIFANGKSNSDCRLGVFYERLNDAKSRNDLALSGVEVCFAMTAFCQKRLHAVNMKLSICTISGSNIDAKDMESFLCLHDKSMEETIRRKK